MTSSAPDRHRSRSIILRPNALGKLKRSSVPEGQGENSPTFQRREFQQRELSPEGTAEDSSLNRPFGTCHPRPTGPNVEMLGYSPSSLRDEPPGTRAALANLRRALALALAATLLATAISPCLGAPTVPGTNIVLGLLLPPEEAEAASLRDGVLLAVEDANASAGPRVNLAIRGRTGQWGADAVEAARMVIDDGAQALIAPPDGGATHLALQVAGRTTTPVVSLCPDSSVTKTGVPWMLRIAPTTIAEARFLLASLNSQTSSPPQWVAVVPDGTRRTRDFARL